MSALAAGEATEQAGEEIDSPHQLSSFLTAYKSGNLAAPILWPYVALLSRNLRCEGHKTTSAKTLTVRL
jgi:hypothetical protein